MAAIPKYFLTVTRQSEGNPATDCHTLTTTTEQSYTKEICEELAKRLAARQRQCQVQDAYLRRDQGFVWNALRSSWRPRELNFSDSLFSSVDSTMSNEEVIENLRAPPTKADHHGMVRIPGSWYLCQGLGECFKYKTGSKWKKIKPASP